jgi:hypothetical protein
MDGIAMKANIIIGRDVQNHSKSCCSPSIRLKFLLVIEDSRTYAIIKVIVVITIIE